MSEFIERVERTIQQRRLLARGRKILVAVSGGADSMVLLHALHRLAPKHHWRLAVAHFNHQLRGRASDADERFVRAAAGKWSLPFFSERGDVAGVARASGISVEMAARKLRHDFLARVARRQKIPLIALAHHADDQVELFFVRLLRGAGGTGLAGMKWSAPSPADPKIALVRPLLGFSKSELLDCVSESKIRFHEDATNFSTDVVRNRIRTGLLPLLKMDYQPGLSKIILRLMDIVGAEAEFANETAQQWLRTSRSSRGDEAQTQIGNRKSEIGNKTKSESPHVGCLSFVELPLAVQRKVLQQQLAGLGLLPDFELIEQLRTGPGRPVSAGTGMTVARDAHGTLSRRQNQPEEFRAAILELKLTGRAGRTSFAGLRLEWKLSAGKGRVRSRPEPACEFFDADRVGDPIILRHWRAGDRFQPMGLKSAAKLQDLFTNQKIPRHQRHQLVVACTGGGKIFWVEGLRMAEQFKLTPQTRRYLCWRWRRG